MHSLVFEHAVFGPEQVPCEQLKELLADAALILDTARHTGGTAGKAGRLMTGRCLRTQTGGFESGSAVGASWEAQAGRSGAAQQHPADAEQ
jgi:hypothetical protein